MCAAQGWVQKPKMHKSSQSGKVTQWTTKHVRRANAHTEVMRDDWWPESGKGAQSEHGVPLGGKAGQ